MTAASDRRTVEVAGHHVLLADSVSFMSPLDEGRAVVSASHGGLSAAEYTLHYRPSLISFNDAGGGKDNAGFRALDILAEHGIAALTVSHESARIGEAEDHWENGIVSRVNLLAAERGLVTGMRLRDAFAHALGGREAAGQ